MAASTSLTGCAQEAKSIEIILAPVQNCTAMQLNFELQHFPVRQLPGLDRSETQSFPIGVKHLACYLTDHKQKSGAAAKV